MQDIQLGLDCGRNDEANTFPGGQYKISNSILCNFTMRAIYFNTEDITSKLLIEGCSFSHDISSDSGGAVYFGTTGEIVFSRVNGIYCSCKYNNKLFGHFAYTKTQNSKSSLNYSSLSSCSTEMEGKFASCFEYGCHEMSDTNISDCKGYNAGFLYNYPSAKSFVQLSNFCNQTADALSYYFSDSEFDLKTIKCNYVLNSGSYFITSENTSLFVENSNFLNNNAKFLFFILQSGNITVINCCLYEKNSYIILSPNRYPDSVNLSKMNDGSCPQIKNQKVQTTPMFKNLYKYRYRSH